MSHGFSKIDWCKSYCLPFLCTRESKFFSLNSSLKEKLPTAKIGVVSDNLCSFCMNSTETLLHLFWEGTFVETFWNDAWMLNNPRLSDEYFSFLSCLGFVNNTSNALFHYILLICTYHIQWFKSMRLLPSRELCMRNILNRLDVEKCYALKSGSSKNFNEKWGAFLP